MSVIKNAEKTKKSQWENGFSIFCFGYGGALYNALGIGAIEIENNFFTLESDAWDCLNNLNGLNMMLSFTVLPVRVFVG